MVSQAPERDQIVSVRLSDTEKARLTRVAVAQDLHVSQLARRCINAQLATLDIEEMRGDHRDGA